MAIDDVNRELVKLLESNEGCGLLDLECLTVEEALTLSPDELRGIAIAKMELAREDIVAAEKLIELARVKASVMAAV